MKIIGPVVAAAGAILTFMIGHNYGACQSIWVQAVSSNQAACQEASTAHLLGIIAMIAGALLFVLGLVTPDRAAPMPPPPPPPRAYWCNSCQRMSPNHAPDCPAGPDGRQS